MKKPFILTVHIQKGGVGKTTTTSLLAAELARRGYNVLMIDTDNQKNLTVIHRMKFAEDSSETRGKNSFNFLTKSMDVGYDPTEYILKTEFDNIWMIPAEHDQPIISEELNRKKPTVSMSMYKTAIEKLSAKVDWIDFILIDCGLALDLAAYNAYQASDYVLIPADPVPNTKECVIPTYSFYKENAEINPKLNAGLVFVNVNIGKSIEKTNMDIISSGLKNVLKVYDSYIRVDTNVEKSQEIRVPTLLQYPRTRAVIDTMELMDELLEECSIPLSKEVTTHA